jgi:hypothetical protein
VTRRLANKAPNGALVKRTFTQRNIWPKLFNSSIKSSPNVELIKLNFGRFLKMRPDHLGDVFQKKCAPLKKFRPNGELYPNLVSLS